MALRFFTPVGVDRTNLEWIYFGYADDTPEMRKRRLRHLNLGGPAGFVSMEDGCVGGFVERGIATAEDAIRDRRDGRRRHRKPGHPRDRGRGARLLVAVAADDRAMSDLLRAGGAERRLCGGDRSDRLEAVAGLLRRRLPLQDHVGREPQARLRRRHHLCRLACDAARPGHRAAHREHLRAAELSPHRRPAGDRCSRHRWHHRRDAVPGRPHHARRTHRSVRDRRLSRQDARGGRAACGSSNVSWSATAATSIRCWPFRCKSCRCG